MAVISCKEAGRARAWWSGRFFKPEPRRRFKRFCRAKERTAEKNEMPDQVGHDADGYGRVCCRWRKQTVDTDGRGRA